MYIIGISAFYHDSAAVLIKNNKIISAVQEERFTRIKHDSSFPLNSINYILAENELTLNDINYIVFYEKPFLKFERLIETYVSNAPKGFSSFRKAMPIWMGEKLFQKSLIYNELKKIEKNFSKDKIQFSEHHLSHASSAFYPSPYNEAIILTVDGVGEWATTSVAIGRGNSIKIIKEINYPHSIGLLYSAFTYYLGFKVNSGEYKVMGLAPYGKPKFKNLILKYLIDLKEDGSFRLNQKFFDYSSNLKMINNNFINLFNQPVRNAEEGTISQFHMDIASSIQSVVEDIMLTICKSIKKEFKIDNLCLAGGVALNCVANSKILNSKIFKNIWVQPASGDAGGALGAALALYFYEFKNERINVTEDTMKGSFLGPQFTDQAIEKELSSLQANYKNLKEENLLNEIARHLSDGKSIGWMNGKMEYGPRALGNRSIIADARSPFMQKQLNLKIKYRESFRPFAPSILNEYKEEWFETKSISPYMLFVAELKKNKLKTLPNNYNDLFGIEKLNINRSVVPAITHVDFSARLQTIHKDTNPKFHSLVKKFFELTGCPLIINTSFNVRGEPIVCTPTDAFNCFMGTELDILVINNYILFKDDQNTKLIKDYKNKYELD